MLILRRALVRMSSRTTLILILSIAATLTHEYVFRIDVPNLPLRMKLHDQIISGHAESPYRYRILVPYANESLIKLLGRVSPTVSREILFIISYLIYDFLAISLLLLGLYEYLRRWFTNEQSLIGVLFVALTIPVMLRDHYFQPWSLLEAGLFSLALLAAYQSRFWVFAGIVAAASLNRETTALIVLACFMARLGEKMAFSDSSGVSVDGINADDRAVSYRRLIFIFGCFAALWGAIYVLLISYLGGAEPIHNPFQLLELNLSAGLLPHVLRLNAVFFGAFWVFAVFGWPYAPGFVRGTLWIIPIYLAVLLFWSVAIEVRLLMTLYPVIVPLGLSYIYRRPAGLQVTTA